MLAMTPTMTSSWCHLCCQIRMTPCCHLCLPAKLVLCVTGHGPCGHTLACLVGCKWCLILRRVPCCGAPVLLCTIGGTLYAACMILWAMRVFNVCVRVCSSTFTGGVWQRVYGCLLHIVMLVSGASWPCQPATAARACGAWALSACSHRPVWAF